MNNFRLFVFSIISLLITFILVLACLDDFSYPNINFSKREKPTTILIFGDMMLDRNVRRVIDSEGLDYIFKGVKSEVEKADLTVANLEGVFTSNQSIAVKNNKILRFTFDPAVARGLKEIGFDLFSEANNHTNDFGVNGIKESFSVIESNQMGYFGDYFNESVYKSVRVKNKKIGFIGFNEFSYKNFENVISQIKVSGGQDDITIVFPHWGVEYVTYSSAFQKKWAREFVDAGADIVVGSHPHVVQEVDSYKGIPIYYSIGNFVFDQYFSTSTMSGLALQLIINNSKLSVREMPIRISTSSEVFFVKD